MAHDLYRELPPGPRLAQYLECYWSRENTSGTTNHYVLPDGCVDILYSARNGEPAALTVVGLMTAAMKVDIAAEESYFGVRFRPGMAAAFLPEAPLLTDRIEPLGNLWHAAGPFLFERLAAASNLKQMAAVMEGFLRPGDPPDAAQRALRQLNAAGLSLDRLAAEAGLSTRQFRRVCRQRAGVPPKFLHRILRFRQAAEKIRSIGRRATQPNWAQFAVACGYYDQAHFIREFQELAGCTPGRFLQSRAWNPCLESVES